jgi:hypothetical protein
MTCLFPEWPQESLPLTITYNQEHQLVKHAKQQALAGWRTFKVSSSASLSRFSTTLPFSVVSLHCCWRAFRSKNGMRKRSLRNRGITG